MSQSPQSNRGNESYFKNAGNPFLFVPASQHDDVAEEVTTEIDSRGSNSGVSLKTQQPPQPAPPQGLNPNSNAHSPTQSAAMNTTLQPVSPQKVAPVAPILSQSYPPPMPPRPVASVPPTMPIAHPYPHGPSSYSVPHHPSAQTPNGYVMFQPNQQQAMAQSQPTQQYCVMQPNPSGPGYILVPVQTVVIPTVQQHYNHQPQPTMAAPPQPMMMYSASQSPSTSLTPVFPIGTPPVVGMDGSATSMHFSASQQSANMGGMVSQQQMNSSMTKLMRSSRGGDRIHEPKDMTMQERALLDAVIQYINEHNEGGSTSFSALQIQLRETHVNLVVEGLARFESSWHRWLGLCPNLTLLQYSEEDINRLSLHGWAERGELRIRLSASKQYQQVDSDKATKHREAVNLAQKICVEAVRSQGPVTVTDLQDKITAKYPYFSGISKSALKRMVLSIPESPLWVTGNVVKIRLPKDQLTVFDDKAGEE
eukprot:PhF_6_TR31415/c4_g1_i1/m.46053